MLVIDDNPEALRAVARALPRNWILLWAQTSRQSIQRALTVLRTLDLVLFDSELPDVRHSAQMYAMIRHHHPQTPVVPFSGYCAASAGRTLPGCCPLLVKPASAQEIRLAVYAALDNPAPLAPEEARTTEAMLHSQAETRGATRPIPLPEAPQARTGSDLAMSVISLIAQHGPLRARELFVRLPPTVHIRTLQRLLAQLLRDDLLEKRGQTNRTRYHLK